MGYIRDKERLDKALKRGGDKVIATESVRMIFPSRWLERDLAVIESTITVLGFVAFATDDDKYAVSKVPGFFRTEPDRITNEEFEGEMYTVFHYSKGSRVIYSTDIVVIDSLVHPIYTEFLGKGRLPWYYDYSDLPSLFEGIVYYNGVDKGGDIAIWSYMAATAARDPDNPQRYFRQRKDLSVKPKLVGLKKVSFHGGNVMAKLGGSYFDAGTTSALANPSTRVERAETMLTKM